MFSISERNSLLAVLNKKKLTLYLWQGTNFIIRKELNLPDAAKTILCSQNAVIVGYKRHYEAIDLTSLSYFRYYYYYYSLLLLFIIIIHY